MNTNEHDDRLRSLFQELKSQDLQAAPTFDRLWNAPPRRAQVHFFTTGLRLAMAAAVLILAAAPLAVYQVKTRQAAAEARQWAALANWDAATDVLLTEASTPWEDRVGTSFSSGLDECWPVSITMPENERRAYEQESEAVVAEPCEA